MCKEMSTTDRNRWNEKYSQRPFARTLDADEWLIEACDIVTRTSPDLPSGAKAIDIACGLGDNSIWLARNGWKVDGIDISATGLDLAKQSATKIGTVVNWLEADLDDWRPELGSYELAIVFRFLDRETVPQIVNSGLKSGGWLIYETFAAGQLDRPGSHIRNPAFTLQPGELPTLFTDFDIVEFREDALADRTVQRLLARRR
jgi:tellurite methyltransferase